MKRERSDIINSYHNIAKVPASSQYRPQGRHPCHSCPHSSCKKTTANKLDPQLPGTSKYLIHLLCWQSVCVQHLMPHWWYIDAINRFGKTSFRSNNDIISYQSCFIVGVSFPHIIIDCMPLDFQGHCQIPSITELTGRMQPCVNKILVKRLIVGRLSFQRWRGF